MKKKYCSFFYLLALFSRRRKSAFLVLVYKTRVNNVFKIYVSEDNIFSYKKARENNVFCPEPGNFFTSSCKNRVIVFHYIPSKMFLDRFYIYIYIHTNLPVNTIVRLPHSRSGDSQGQETFLAPSGDKQTRNYDTVLKPPSLPINTKVKGIEP